MIPVAPANEPAHFDHDVRQPGQAWLQAHGIEPDKAAPAGADIRAFWNTGDLWDAYGGVCAYYAYYIERTSGVTTDHYVPKTRNPGLAYEWSNYRLASSTANSRKGTYDDVIDPFTMPQHTFTLNLANGLVSVNPAMPVETVRVARSTLSRLQLNDTALCAMRVRRFMEYAQGSIDRIILERYAPFVYQEMLRQGLL